MSISEINRQRKLFFDHYIRQILFILAWVGCASIWLKGFLLPNTLLDWGVTWVSLLVNILTDIDLPVLIVLINLPFVILGSIQISWKFWIKTIWAILLLAFLVEHLSINTVTDDRLLTAVFWGFFLWAGIWLSMRWWCVIDGTEVLAIFVSRYTTLSVWDFIWIFNILLFLLAASLVDIETVLYSMLTYIVASKTVDFVVNGIEEYIWLTIISEHPNSIQQILIENHWRKATIYKWESDMRYFWTLKEKKKKIVYCVVTRLEVPRIMYDIEKIDPESFIVQSSVKDVKWWLIKKRAFH